MAETARFLGDFAGDRGVLGPFEDRCLRSSAGRSRAAYSSRDGTFSLMFSLRTPAVRLSTSVGFSPALAAGRGFSEPSPADNVERKADGTRGTGGTFLGLADRLGVDDREELVLRPGVAVRVFEVLVSWDDALGRTSARGEASGSGVEVAVELALFRRVERTDGDGSAKSVVESMVVLRLLLSTCRLGVSAVGVPGNEDFGLRTRSFMRFSSGAVDALAFLEFSAAV